MGLFGKLGMEKPFTPSIDWDITPMYTFTMFESWGGKGEERIRNNDEKFYYFFIDNWQKPAQLCLMERGVKHAEILAMIDAPQKMIDTCVTDQGKSGTFDRNYAIDEVLKNWLKKNVVYSDDDSMVTPIKKQVKIINLETGLPRAEDPHPAYISAKLRADGKTFTEDELPELIAKNNLFDSQRNITGSFPNVLIDNGDGLTVTDLKTGIMWQREGCDIANILRVKSYVRELKANEFAGFNDWRLPTTDEAMSLLEPHIGEKDLFIHKCFSDNQPFIFTADRRSPGGYWFVDFKQGTVFWASGTIPGGFGRACRTI
ncbi:MAG: DUF1566 domain-containing protein [Proteobacteria bacterium]|nr:DUF1566 domain-containing protein [Pseudomonadota bacterium]MBU1716580.1 DUF1566 domain-containing protein [Pseudomonadota bacterium]